MTLSSEAIDGPVDDVRFRHKVEGADWILPKGISSGTDMGDKMTFLGVEHERFLSPICGKGANRIEGVTFPGTFSIGDLMRILEGEEDVELTISPRGEYVYFESGVESFDLVRARDSLTKRIVRLEGRESAEADESLSDSITLIYRTSSNAEQGKVHGASLIRS